jgi:hypothetical protein
MSAVNDILIINMGFHDPSGGDIFQHHLQVSQGILIRKNCDQVCSLHSGDLLCYR